MTTGKTIALTIQTFVSKVMSLLFNMLSRLVITFLPRSKRLKFSLQLLRFIKVKIFICQRWEDWDKQGYCFKDRLAGVE